MWDSLSSSLSSQVKEIATTCSKNIQILKYLNLGFWKAKRSPPHCSKNIQILCLKLSQTKYLNLVLVFQRALQISPIWRHLVICTLSWVHLSPMRDSGRFLKVQRDPVLRAVFDRIVFNVTKPVAIPGFNSPPPFSLIRSIWMWDTFQGKLSSLILVQYLLINWSIGSVFFSSSSTCQFKIDLSPMFTEQLKHWLGGEFKDSLNNQQVYSRLIRAECNQNQTKKWQKTFL